MKIMFVCHGNICRSPMAEFIFKDMLKNAGISEGFTVCSSATSSEEIWNGIGNPVYPPAREELLKHGISSEGKRAVQLKKSDYENFDLFLCMDGRNLVNAKRMLGGDKENIKVPDFNGYSLSEVKTILSYLDINYEIEGNGYVYSQSIEKDSLIVDDMTIKIYLKDYYTVDKNNEEED